jgi:hypothetical protein
LISIAHPSTSSSCVSLRAPTLRRQGLREEIAIPDGGT